MDQAEGSVWFCCLIISVLVIAEPSFDVRGKADVDVVSVKT